ncbi:MAG: nucleotidyltransferase family protein [Bdellovibrionota bacterium]
MDTASPSDSIFLQKISFLEFARCCAIEDGGGSVSSTLPQPCNYLFELLAWHNLLGIANPVLSNRNLPASQREFRDRILSGESDRVERLKNKWKQLSEFLDSLGVEYIPIKGISHLQKIYRGEPRNMGDIDVIFPTESVPQVLQELYKKWQGVPESYRADAARFRWHRNLVPIEDFSVDSTPLGRMPVYFKDFALDLHWSPTYGSGITSIRLPNHKLFECSERWPEMGALARSLRPETELAFGLLHAATSEHKIMLHVVDLVRQSKRYGVRPEVAAQDWYDPQIVPGVRETLEMIDFLASPNTDLRELATHRSMVPYFGSQERYPELLRAKPSDDEIQTPVLFYYRRACAQRSWRARFAYVLGFLIPSPEYYPEQKLVVRVVWFYSRWFLSCARGVKRLFLG